MLPIRHKVGDEVSWALGGIFDDGVPRCIKRGKILRETRDGNYVIQPNDVTPFTQLFYPEFGMVVVPHEIILEGRHVTDQT